MSKLIDLKVNEFIKEVDSDSPAPGGGSVSSLASTVGCALARMVGHLTFGKKKFEELEEAQKSEFLSKFNSLEVFQDKLKVLIDKDTESFGIFMKALKLPKETDEEKKFRFEQMELATMEIIKVPFEIAKISIDALESLNSIIEYGNKNAITDVGVAALLLYAGVEGAVLNVKINLPGLSDDKLVNDYLINCEEFVEKASSLKNKYLDTVNKAL